MKHVPTRQASKQRCDLPHLSTSVTELSRDTNNSFYPPESKHQISAFTILTLFTPSSSVPTNYVLVGSNVYSCDLFSKVLAFSLFVVAN